MEETDLDKRIALISRVTGQKPELIKARLMTMGGIPATGIRSMLGGMTEEDLRAKEPGTTLGGVEAPGELETPDLTAGQAQQASEYPPDVANTQSIGESGDYLNQPSGLEAQSKTGGGAGWTNAATLALANSMPKLIEAAYQRPDRPQGRSVGGGKPAFQMADPFAGKRDKFRSLMAQYLR